MLKERIINYYKPQLNIYEKTMALQIKGEHGEYSIYADTDIILTFSKAVEYNKEQALQNGAIVTTIKDLSEYLFPGEYELLKEHSHNKKMGIEASKIKRFIERQRYDTGLLGLEYYAQGSIFRIQDTFQITSPQVADSTILTGKIKNGNYIAQYATKSLYEDKHICAMTFLSMPTKEQIEIALASFEMEAYFEDYGYDQATFECQICETKHSLLEIESNFIDMLRFCKEKVCQDCANYL